jgi:alcohol dehydrogenase class IV
MATIDPEMLRGNWSYPTTIRFGAGRVAELPDACAALGIARPLLITDPGLAGHAIGERVLALARAALPVALFADVRPNPTGADVAAGVEALRKGGHDGVIALGGGSALDAAKAIAFMAAQERPIWDFEDRGDNWRRGLTSGLPPVVAVPTTAGTGSEVGRAAVITREDTHEKCIVFHPRMLPGQVIADPELTPGLPANLTAWTGIDARLCRHARHDAARGSLVFRTGRPGLSAGRGRQRDVREALHRRRDGRRTAAGARRERRPGGDRGSAGRREDRRSR